MKPKSIFILLILLSLSWSDAFAQTVPALMQQGRTLLELNKMDSAMLCFEKVLALDSKNYDALVYLCNYHFLSGQKALDKIETVYLSHESPTRMQVAQYNEDLIGIYKVYYSKAEKYLIQAYLLRRNDHLDDMAGQIADFKVRIGILTPGTKKTWLKRILPL